MNIQSLRVRFGAFLCAAQAWMAETTQESRSARLSTLGLSGGKWGSACHDESGREPHFR